VYHLTRIQYGIDNPEEVCIKVFAKKDNPIESHKKAGTQTPVEESPTNVRCKAPHLIRIILAYSPKKRERRG
jgi:hypothetical protein